MYTQYLPVHQISTNVHYIPIRKKLIIRQIYHIYGKLVFIMIDLSVFQFAVPVNWARIILHYSNIAIQQV